MVHTQPEEQQGTQEHGLEEVVQHPQGPVVHQEGEGEDRIWKQKAGGPGEGGALKAVLFSQKPKSE